MVDKELIEIWRNMLKPAISLWLLNTNYEEMGEQDKEEFERDFDEFLDLALIGMKHKAQLSQEDTTKDTTPSTCSTADTISRQVAIDAVDAIGHIATMPDGDKCVRRSAVKCTLSMLPSAQPEYVTGSWLIRKWGDDAKCSNCGKTHKDVYDMENYDAFCRCCGAKMEGLRVVIK